MKGGSQCDPAALAGRIKLRCRYECKATDPCLWFCSHRVGHLFAAQRKKGVSRGQAQILTVKFAPFTSGNRRPSLFFNNTASYLIWFVLGSDFGSRGVCMIRQCPRGFSPGTPVPCPRSKNTHYSLKDLNLPFCARVGGEQTGDQDIAPPLGCLQEDIRRSSH